MRLFPPPWEGKFNGPGEAPPPFPCYPGIYFIPGAAAAVAWPLGSVARFLFTSKKTPLTTAKVTAAAVLLMTSAGAVRTIQGQRDFAQRLKEGGVELPRRKLADRWTKFDGENYLVLGGIIGVAVASRRPAAWASSRLQKSIRYLAAYSYGTAFSTLGLGLVPPAGYNDAAQIWHVHHEIDDAARLSKITPHLPWAVPQRYLDEDPGRYLAGADWIDERKHEEISELMSRWDADPRPHQSVALIDENANASRGFLPARTVDTVYLENSPELDRKLDEHLKSLTARRDTLSKEAEAMWRKGSLAYTRMKQLMDAAPPHDPPGQGFSSDRDAALQIFHAYSSLQVTDEMHSRVWAEISEVDWLIADTKRLQFQLRARSKGATWDPSRKAPTEDVPLNFVRAEAWKEYYGLWSELRAALPTYWWMREQSQRLSEHQGPVDSFTDDAMRQDLEQLKDAMLEIKIMADRMAAMQSFLTDIGCPELLDRLTPKMDLRGADFHFDTWSDRLREV